MKPKNVKEISNIFLQFCSEPIWTFLEDKEALANLYNECQTNEGLVNGPKLAMAFLIDLYIIEILKRNVNIDKEVLKRQIKNYVDIQNYRIKDNYFNFISNPIYFLDNRFLKSMFNDDSIRQIRNFQKKLFFKANDIAEKYFLDEKVDEKDFAFLLKFLNSNINNNYQLIGKTLSITEQVLTKSFKNGNYSDPDIQLLMLNFMNKQKEEHFGINSFLLVTDFNSHGEAWSERNVGTACSNIILLNRSQIGNNDKFLDANTQLLNLQLFFFHEFFHVRQYYDDLLDLLNSRTFNSVREFLFMEELLPDSNSNSESLNYCASEVEISANYFAASQTLKFTKKYFPQLYNKYKSGLELSVKNRKWETFCFDKVDEIKGNHHMLKEQYNVVLLNDIVGEKPQYLKKHKVLSTFYEKDGTPKSLAKLLNEEYNLVIDLPTKEQHDMTYLYHDYVTTYILDGDLDKIKLNESSADGVLNTLLNHYENTLKTIDFPLSYLNTNKYLKKDDVIENMVQERIDILHYYERFFNQSKQFFTPEIIKRQKYIEIYRLKIINDLWVNGCNDMQWEGNSK